MKIEIDGRDLLAELGAQRNRALDEAANYAAQVHALQRIIESLEERLKNADAAKPEAKDQG